MSFDRAELLKVVASLSPEERAAMFGAAPASAETAAHKWAHLADALSDADVVKVVHACRAGIKHAADTGAEGTDTLAEVAPVLARAARESAYYRKKPYVFSLAGVAAYLQSEAFAAKRAAAARRVPPAAEVPAVRGAK